MAIVMYYKAVNAFKCWLAQKIIESFDLCWNILQRIASRALPVKEHYYVMKIFRFFFRTYPVRITYSNPIDPRRLLELHVDLCENNQQWFFRHTWEYELMEMRVLSEGMKEAEVFVDAGSNVGVFALTIAQAFPDKRVMAFEPNPENFSRLAHNISANRLSNCDARQKAVFHSASPARFYVNPIHDGGGSLLRPTAYRTGDVRIDTEKYLKHHPGFHPWVEVQTVRLDEIIDRRSVVKIDVEGAEVEAVRSASSALEAGWVDLMVIEVQQHTVAEVLRLLEPFQFDVLLLPDGIPLSGEDGLGRFSRNIACVRRNSPSRRRVSRIWG